MNPYFQKKKHEHHKKKFIRLKKASAHSIPMGLISKTQAPKQSSYSTISQQLPVNHNRKSVEPQWNPTAYILLTQKKSSWLIYPQTPLTHRGHSSNYTKLGFRVLNLARLSLHLSFFLTPYLSRQRYCDF